MNQEINTSVAGRIKAFNSDKLQTYLPIKYRMMSTSAFRFLRGTCHLFYEDLSASGFDVKAPLSWICGDLHLENFGSFKGDNRLVYFDLNDFDEALLAPASWEIVRMVTSIYCAFESLGIKRREANDMAGFFLKQYCTTLSNGKAKYIEPQIARGITRQFLNQVLLRKNKDLVRQRTLFTDGKLMLQIDNKRIFKLKKSDKRELISYVQKWVKEKENELKHYRILDAGFRIAGTGSIGVKRYIFLLQHVRNEKRYFLLDMKQAFPSSIAPYLSVPQPQWNDQAHRVVTLQQRMQNIYPALLSTISYKGDDFVLKELQPTQDKIDFLVIKDQYKDIECVLEDMALVTASAQIRSTGRSGSSIADELESFGKEIAWKKSLVDYAEGYAIKVKKDYADYCEAFNEGYFTK